MFGSWENKGKFQALIVLFQREGEIQNVHIRQIWATYSYFLMQNCLLTGQEQARITRLFGWLSPCQKWLNAQENGTWVPQSEHIHRWYPFPDQPRKEEKLVKPVFWHWVLFIFNSDSDLTICSWFSLGLETVNISKALFRNGITHTSRQTGSNGGFQA